ncbi:hypothetical protein OROGR_028679 [Orobanche gracilis]
MADRDSLALAAKSTCGLRHANYEVNQQMASARDPALLVDKLGEELSQKHLDKLISVHLIIDMHDGPKPKQKMLYFLEYGKVYKITEHDLLVKSWKEREYVLFLLKEENVVFKRWRARIKASIAEQKRNLKIKQDECKPKYLNDKGEEVEMKKNFATIETSFGVSYLSFNPESEKACTYLGQSIRTSKIRDLKAAIYQTRETTEELRRIKAEMIKLLEAAEEKHVADFLNMNPLFRRVEESDDLIPDDNRW